MKTTRKNDVQMRGCANVQINGYADMQMCESADGFAMLQLMNRNFSSTHLLICISAHQKIRLKNVPLPAIMTT
jgi:hypothetical protein